MKLFLGGASRLNSRWCTGFVPPDPIFPTPINCLQLYISHPAPNDSSLWMLEFSLACLCAWGEKWSKIKGQIKRKRKRRGLMVKGTKWHLLLPRWSNIYYPREVTLLHLVRSKCHLVHFTRHLLLPRWSNVYYPREVTLLHLGRSKCHFVHFTLNLFIFLFIIVLHFSPHANKYEM